MVEPAEIDRQGKALPAARDLAALFAAAVRDHFGLRLRRICLFGSAARGDWSFESDVDILVLLDRLSSEDIEWLVRQSLRMGVFANGILLQPIPMEEQAFQHLRERERRFAAEVEQDGIEL